MADDLGGGHQQSVFDEQVVLVGEAGAEGSGEELRPQLTFQPDAGRGTGPLVEGRKVGDIEGVRGTAGTEPPGDLARGRDEMVGRGQHPVQPNHQAIHVSATQLEAGDETERGVIKVVQVPLDAVGENSHITAAHHRNPVPHVPGQLFNGFSTHVAGPQVPLHLEHRCADLDIDASPKTNLGLQVYIKQVAVTEVEASTKQQHSQITLDIRLRPIRTPVSQSDSDSSKLLMGETKHKTPRYALHAWLGRAVPAVCHYSQTNLRICLGGLDM